MTHWQHARRDWGADLYSVKGFNVQKNQGKLDHYSTSLFTWRWLMINTNMEIHLIAVFTVGNTVGIYRDIFNHVTQWICTLTCTLIHHQSVHPCLSARCTCRSFYRLQWKNFDTFVTLPVPASLYVIDVCVGVHSRKCKGSSMETKALPHLHISARVLSFHWRLRLLSI